MSSRLEEKLSLIFNRDSVSDAAPASVLGTNGLAHLITSRSLQSEPHAQTDDALDGANMESKLLTDLENDFADDDERQSLMSTAIRFDAVISFHPSDATWASRIKDHLTSLELEVTLSKAADDGKSVDVMSIAESAFFCPILSATYQDDPTCKKEMLMADEIARPMIPIYTATEHRTWPMILTAGYTGLDAVPALKDDDEWGNAMEELFQLIANATASSNVSSPSKGRLSTRSTDVSQLGLETSRVLSTISSASSQTPPGTPNGTRSRRASAFLRLSSPLPGRPNSLPQQFKPVASKGGELLRDWLKPMGYYSEFDALAGACHSSTRKWVLNDITDWMLSEQKPSKALWLHGPSGSGKSVAVAKWCKMLPPNFHVVWFQIRADHSDRSLPSKIINTLAYRLSMGLEGFREKLMAVYSGGGKDVVERETATTQRVRKLVVDPLRECEDDLRKGYVVIVLDGIDALPDGSRRDLLDALRGEWERLPGNVRFVFSGVKTNAVKSDLGAFKPKEIELGGQMHRKDLFSCAGSLVPTILANIDEEDRDEAASILTAKSMGLFLWMHLAFEPLRTAGSIATTARQLLATLETFPQGIDNVYEGLLNSAFDRASHYSDLDLYKKIVGALLVLKEPITIACLATLLDISLSETRRTLYRISAFVSFCSDADLAPNGSSFQSGNTAFHTRVRLAHTDFRDYVTTSRCTSRFKLNLGLAEAEVAMRCMVALMGSLRPNPLDLEDPVAWLNEEIPDREKRLDLKVGDAIRYSARYWCFHLASLGMYVGDVALSDVPGEKVTVPRGDPVDPKVLKATEDLACLVCAEKILEWMELASILGEVESMGVAALRALLGYLDSIKAAGVVSSVMGYFARNLVGAAKSISSGSEKDGKEAAGPVPASVLRLIASPALIDLGQAKGVVKDSQRFLQHFRVPIVRSAYHVYISALPFSPQGSTLHKIYSPKMARAASSAPSFRRVPQVIRGAPQAWNPCLWVLRAHTRNVSAVSVSMDGRWIVSGGHDRAVRVFDAETGMLSRTLEGHLDQVWNVTCSADGRWIVSGGADEMVKTWDAGTGKCLRSGKGKTWGVNALAMTADGSRIVSVSTDKTVIVRDAREGETVWTLKGHQGGVCGVCVSPDGNYIVSCGEDRTIRVWDMGTGRGVRTLEGHANVVNAVCVSPDGRWIVSGSKDTTVRVWELETGKCVQVLEGHVNSVNCVAVSPDGRRIVSGSDDRTVRVWECDPARGLGLGVQALIPASLMSAAAAAASAAIAAASTGAGGSPAPGASVPAISPFFGSDDEEGHGNVVRALAVSDDGRFVTSAGADSTVRVWNAETGKLIRVIETRTLNVASWDDAARKVAKAEMVGLTDGGANGIPDDDEEEGEHPRYHSPRRNGPTVLSVNGVSVSPSLAAKSLVEDGSESGSRPGTPSFEPGVLKTKSQNGVWSLEDDGWLLDRKENGTRRVWVPPSLRGQIVSFHNRIVAIGTPSGHVVIMHV
ncbi:POC1 centriolar protein A [Phlyctochytrium planicorne]|nr:POC1 centriolar protein A [Phlyctochytrium planicorne]